MLQNRFYPRKILLLAVDLLLLFISLFLALKIRQLWGEHTYSFANHIKPFFLIFIFWILIFYLFDLFDLQKIKSLSFSISTLILSIGVSTAFSIIFFYVFSSIITPKTVLVILAVISLLLLSLWHHLWSRVFAPKFKTRIAIIGNEEDKSKIFNEILNPTEHSYEIIGFVDLNKTYSFFGEELKLLGNYEDLDQIIEKERIEELVTAFDYYKNEKAVKKIMDCMCRGLKITEMPLFYEEATGKIPIENINQSWLLSHISGNKKIYEILKRIVDIIFSAIGLIISLPFIPLIALLIKIDSKGPIFYTQYRLGKNEKRFRVYKFRTMVKDAEKSTGPVWAKNEDPRITRVGKFLRRFRLDEIPQLFNVLKGNMSLVGPRPEREKFVLELKEKIPFYSYRHMVKPGVTGWAQIKYRYSNSKDTAMEKTQYDLFYIKNRSIILYFIIILRTIRTILSRKGI